MVSVTYLLLLLLLLMVIEQRMQNHIRSIDWMVLWMNRVLSRYNRFDGHGWLLLLLLRR